MNTYLMVALLTMSSGDVLRTTFPALLNDGRKPIISMNRCVVEAQAMQDRMNAAYDLQDNGMFKHIRIFCKKGVAPVNPRYKGK